MGRVAWSLAVAIRMQETKRAISGNNFTRIYMKETACDIIVKCWHSCSTHKIFLEAIIHPRKYVVHLVESDKLQGLWMSTEEISCESFYTIFSIIDFEINYNVIPCTNDQSEQINATGVRKSRITQLEIKYVVQHAAAFSRSRMNNMFIQYKKQTF